MSCSADRQALGKITADGVFLEQLETDPAQYLPDDDRTTHLERRRRARSTSTGRWPRSAPSCRSYPVKTRLSLTGPLVVARDIAHAKIKERLDAGEGMPQYLQGPLPSTTPARRRRPRATRRARSGRPPPGRMDAYVDQFQAAGGSHGDARQGQPLASRSPTRARSTAASTSARSAARRRGSRRTASSKVEVLEYPELGMEAVWKIEVDDFPAFIVVDDKGNDFFAVTIKPMACHHPRATGLL